MADRSRPRGPHRGRMWVRRCPDTGTGSRWAHQPGEPYLSLICDRGSSRLDPDERSTIYISASVALPLLGERLGGERLGDLASIGPAHPDLVSPGPGLGRQPSQFVLRRRDSSAAASAPVTPGLRGRCRPPRASMAASSSSVRSGGRWNVGSGYWAWLPRQDALYERSSASADPLAQLPRRPPRLTAGASASS